MSINNFLQVSRVIHNKVYVSIVIKRVTEDDAWKGIDIYTFCVKAVGSDKIISILVITNKGIVAARLVTCF
jgi:hypothetical protein